MTRRLQLSVLAVIIWSTLFVLIENHGFLFRIKPDDETNHQHLSESNDHQLFHTTNESSLRVMAEVHSTIKETCTPSCQNCSSLKFFETPTRSVGEIFRINGITTTKKAICVWNGEEINRHLPHWLEIVYRCWSWWMIHNETHDAVIEIPVKSEPFWTIALTSPLGGGLWQHMQQALSIEIVVIPNNTNTTLQGLRATPIIRKTPSAEPWFIDTHTARALRDYVVSTAFPGRSLDGCRNANAPQMSAVRIGVLDRLKTRQLLNHYDIIISLQNLTSTPIMYKTFEGASYEEQIDFYSSVDILVTPHGAQLSAVPFMPSCGCVLELLPKYYHYEFFFGPLTTSANLTSSYLYLSDGNATEETMLSQNNYTFRKKTRSANLCPPINSIVKSVRTLIERWKSCCSERYGV